MPRTIRSPEGVEVDYDVVFTQKTQLFEFLERELPSRTDSCLSLYSFNASQKLVRGIFENMFESSQQCSLSFLSVNDSSLVVSDLFSTNAGKNSSTVTGIKVSSAAQTMETLIRFAPSIIELDTTIVLTASRLAKDGTKQRMHMTFGGVGVWQAAVALSPEHLLSKLVSRCTCFRVATAATSDFAAEWRAMFPKSEARQLQEALRRVAQLEEQLAEAQRRMALRENTLINVLISTHSAFQGLSDYPRRQKPVQDKENGLKNRGIEWDVSVTDKTAPAKSVSAMKAKKPQQMLRTLSTGNSGAVRVSRTPGRTPGRTKTAGQTPGAVKSKSRVF